MDSMFLLKPGFSRPFISGQMLGVGFTFLSQACGFLGVLPVEARQPCPVEFLVLSSNADSLSIDFPGPKVPHFDGLLHHALPLLIKLAVSVLKPLLDSFLLVLMTQLGLVETGIMQATRTGKVAGYRDRRWPGAFPAEKVKDHQKRGEDPNRDDPNPIMVGVNTKAIQKRHGSR